MFKHLNVLGIRLHEKSKTEFIVTNCKLTLLAKGPPRFLANKCNWFEDFNLTEHFNLIVSPSNKLVLDIGFILIPEKKTIMHNE